MTNPTLEEISPTATESTLLRQAETVINQLSLAELLWLLEQVTQRIRKSIFVNPVSEHQKGELFRQSLQQMRLEIANRGGLYPQQTDEAVLNQLAQNREELYAQKYATYFGHE